MIKNDGRDEGNVINWPDCRYFWRTLFRAKRPVASMAVHGHDGSRAALQLQEMKWVRFFLLVPTQQELGSPYSYAARQSMPTPRVLAQNPSSPPHTSSPLVYN